MLAAAAAASDSRKEAERAASRAAKIQSSVTIVQKAVEAVLKLPSVVYVPGTVAEYFSEASNTWIPAKVLCFRFESNVYDLNVTRGAAPSQIRLPRTGDTVTLPGPYETAAGMAQAAAAGAAAAEAATAVAVAAERANEAAVAAAAKAELAAGTAEVAAERAKQAASTSSSRSSDTNNMT
eukprot:gnl/TRDRNA2_/TRDRNA2_139060_c1_seq1.p1 gnl/TRDRNA2_/TRDRNA2_139060_c1~~gnl/TRDRNA2_/TRDRNA2_139060_c1_seq1.p1  ORF type:complete len:195 (+),score=45.33 gnl/TRDRNA2_/TRDRNA2_139060_c1_seq1:47-586(+)